MNDATVALFVIAAGILSWSFFMFRMQRELLHAHREIVNHMVAMKIAQANALLIPSGVHLPRMTDQGRVEPVLDDGIEEDLQ